MNESNGTKVEQDPIDILEVNLKSVAEEISSHASSPDTQAHDTEAHGSETHEVKPSTSRITKAIKDHPLLAIGIAFSAGFVFMRLLRRSLRWV
jgi:hypothetical protein